MGGTLAAAASGGSVGYLSLGYLSVGYVVGLLVIPVVGLVVLILGLRWYRRTQPGHPPVWHPAPPPQRSPGRSAAGPIVMIVLGCVAMVLGLLGAGLGVLVARDEAVSEPTPEALQVGQCISDSQYASAEMPPQPSDCSRRDAVYELAYRGEGPSATCPDGLREDSGYAVLFNNTDTYCFVLNVAEGQCFFVDPDAQLFTPVDCADPSANSRIDRIFDGAEDLSRCPAGPRGAAFPEPARTYCVVSPG